MRFFALKYSVAVLFTLAVLLSASSGQEKNYTRRTDIIYTRKFGSALTFDIFQPHKPNGIGIISVVSGGWFSQHPSDSFGQRLSVFLDRGYTVFAVVHGSQPKYAIPEILEDMHRAVRFIRFHAKEYGIDPVQIGITGGSAGGHLSLMQGTAGDLGKADAKDPIDRVSSRVQAVACFYPPTDFLNYGKPGEIAVGRGILWNYAGAFDFKDYDPYYRKLVPITDEEKILEIGRKISPVTHASADDPPTLIVHGNKDWLVPIQQGESMIEKLKAAGVEAKLLVKEGGDHGWPDMKPEAEQIAAWFDTHLKRPTAVDGSGQ